jgi:hypothetical protein
MDLREIGWDGMDWIDLAQFKMLLILLPTFVSLKI